MRETYENKQFDLVHHDGSLSLATVHESSRDTPFICVRGFLYDAYVLTINFLLYNESDDKVVLTIETNFI